MLSVFLTTIAMLESLTKKPHFDVSRTFTEGQGHESQLPLYTRDSGSNIVSYVGDDGGKT